MEFEIGQKIFKINVSIFSKKITELEITRVNPKTLSTFCESESKRIPTRFFDNPQEGVIYDSFVQYATTIEDADRISIQLMDRVLDRKYIKRKEINGHINKALKVRNSPPTIRRMC